MIEPRRAPVRPRVFAPDEPGYSLLEDLVTERIASGQGGLIILSGPAGSGKSTAIEHLAHRFDFEPMLVLADNPDDQALVSRCAEAQYLLVVCAGTDLAVPLDAEQWSLAPWGRDEWIEYLLTEHRTQCGSVMQRLGGGSVMGAFCGRPALCRPVLDRFACDEQLSDVVGALRQEVHDRLVSLEALDEARLFCFAACHGVNRNVEELLALWDAVEPSGQLLLRHDQVQLLLAAEFLAAEIVADRSLKLLRLPLGEPLLRETAKTLRENRDVIDRLRTALTDSDDALHSTTASLLLAADPAWVPRRGRDPLLAGAFLAGAQWRGVRLARLDVSRADLSGADLSEARLKRVCAHDTRLNGACLHGAILKRLSAIDARLPNADLSQASAVAADFRGADLQEANLAGALLRRTQFENADLRGANFTRADLTHAQFGGAQIEGADFTGADLWGANLPKIVLRLAEFSGARFIQSSLIGCDLEYMQLPGANFSGANLHRAHLTATRMPSARFYRANLTATGLAEIEWENADLREADFVGCTFHMGSSRSGLVGSPIACEGSRTGFYTDEYHEQDFKAPEEIRKANLCGADLRGARIENVDFYLVDLRGARYTDDQAIHFRRCGAILETRV